MGDDKRFFRGTSAVSSFRKSLRRSSLLSRQLSAPAVALLSPGTGQMRKKDVGYSPFGQEQEEEAPMIKKEEKTGPIGQSEEEDVSSGSFEGNSTNPSGDCSLQVRGDVEDASNKDKLDGPGLGEKSRKKHRILHTLIQRVQTTVQVAAAFARRKISVKKYSKSDDLNMPPAPGSEEDSSG